MRRLLAGLVAVGVLVLAGQAALAGNPPPRTVNGVVNPQVGQVVATFDRLDDGSCALGDDGITLTASPDAGETGVVAVEFDAQCRAVVVAAGDPGPVPGGVTVEATP